MRIILLSWIFLIYFTAKSLPIDATLISGRCQSNQHSLLLQMKRTLIFNSTISIHMVQWNQSTDCCTWSGVDCDGAGRVIGLNLSNESISGGIDDNATSLFSLQYLKSLNLAFNRFNATPIPSWLAKLTNLTCLNLSNAGFAEEIPSTKISGMKRLVTLDLSSNSFVGPIPPFHMLTNLSYLDLSHNVFTGSISSTHWDQLQNLLHIDFSSNSLNGSIPPTLFSLPSLQKLQLANNQFADQVPEFLNASFSILEILDLSGNRFDGPIPMSVFKLRKLNILLLQFNKFSGLVPLSAFQRLGNLRTLDLSFNNLAVKASSSGSSLLPQLSKLRLASCNLSVIPNLKSQSHLFDLDLSDNQISGKVPAWIWKVGEGSLTHLNLSHNLLVGMEGPYSFTSLRILDMHSNKLQGQIPQRLPTAVYGDYSSNYFNSSIPANIGNSLSSTTFFSLSNNSITDVIPESICNATNLEVLNLSDNNLSGSVPACLIRRSKTLGVLNLGGNSLNDAIPDSFPKDCGLRTLDLNGNQIEGVIPRSLNNCLNLEVLDIGNNRINDVFVCWLRSPRLRILVLRSNKFHGSIVCQGVDFSWPFLQIADLSSNNFSGELPNTQIVPGWKAMTVDENEVQSNLQLRYEFRGFHVNQLYYQDAVTVINKGQKMELLKIITLFTSVDLSCNNFQGPIPQRIGILKSQHNLNMSHNFLTGPIPSSIGNMRQLESLDFSVNNLNGKIPAEIASLSFLSFLNLSYNHLIGSIPISTQLQSFSPTSFEGNEGLCGPPLTKECKNSSKLLVPSMSTSTNRIDWKFIMMAVGFSISFGAVVTPLIFSKKVNKWYDDQIKRFLPHLR